MGCFRGASPGLAQYRGLFRFPIRDLSADPGVRSKDIPGVGGNFWGGFPKKASAAINILGVTIDMHSAPDEHDRDVFAKAQIGQGILSEFAGRRRGLEVGILKTSHDAVIRCLLRYALAATSPSYPPDPIRGGNTRKVNVAVRRLVRASRGARIGSLHSTDGTPQYYNPYARH